MPNQVPMVQQTWHALTDELVHRQPWPEANLSQCRHSFTFSDQKIFLIVLPKRGGRSGSEISEQLFEPSQSRAPPRNREGGR